jgi:thiamine biosynthesis lipoprotein ApbE
VIKRKPGKHYRVEINYTNAKGERSNQFIEVNQRNVSTSGSNLIDARVLSKMV